MDISENYIKMCKKAIQIQDLWEYKQGDWFVDKDFYKYGVNVLENDIRDDSSGDYFYSKTELIKSLKDNDSIWLPRQDQLQEMISNDINKIIKTMWDDLSWGKDRNKISRNPLCIIDLKSMEQYWLVLVMKEEYQKQWNGEDWVSVK